MTDIAQEAEIAMRARSAAGRPRREDDLQSRDRRKRRPALFAATSPAAAPLPEGARQLTG
ncbi:hypothetical protein [Aureimonas glaciei]|uniref:hypothetical protein n=1 Tax=Aureimonas glaciei TaxID=1776957 RepID=UPI001663AD58|nr:hypothetical protein [Aureimonas glaciei]